MVIYLLHVGMLCGDSSDWTVLYNEDLRLVVVALLIGWIDLVWIRVVVVVVLHFLRV